MHSIVKRSFADKIIMKFHAIKLKLSKAGENYLFNPTNIGAFLCKAFEFKGGQH
jgi:hypothetical protein